MSNSTESKYAPEEVEEDDMDALSQQWESDSESEESDFELAHQDPHSRPYHGYQHPVQTLMDHINLAMDRWQKELLRCEDEKRGLRIQRKMNRVMKFVFQFLPEHEPERREAEELKRFCVHRKGWSFYEHYVGILFIF